MGGGWVGAGEGGGEVEGGVMGWGGRRRMGDEQRIRHIHEPAGVPECERGDAAGVVASV